jgi:hypothetical protein
MVRWDQAAATVVFISAAGRAEVPAMRTGARGKDDSPVRGLLARPGTAKPARFGGSRIVGDFVILGWETAFGSVGWAHSMTASYSEARTVSGALYGQFWNHMDRVYAAVVTARAPAGLDLAPELTAIDLHKGARTSREYEVTWRQLAAVLGVRAPWFPPELRYTATIAAWQPGDPPAIVPANHVELPLGPLLELAADEPDGSPAAAVCTWLARRIRRVDTEHARESIGEIRDAGLDASSDCHHVDIAAVPAPLLRADDTYLDEIVQRAGWAQIVERRDVLAAAVAHIVLAWDGGKSWPVGQTAEFDPASCAVAAEWTDRLRPAAGSQPPTVLERLLLQHVTSVDRGELLYDETSGCAAVRRTDHMGEVTIHAGVSQRISTFAPLAEVILSDRTVWVRTSDGGLWLAPALPGRGLSWGYRGGGPYALAALLNRLLDDINGRPADFGDNPTEGLLDLIAETPQDGTTTYTRDQLLSARRQGS